MDNLLQARSKWTRSCSFNSFSNTLGDFISAWTSPESKWWCTGWIPVLSTTLHAKECHQGIPRMVSALTPRQLKLAWPGQGHKLRSPWDSKQAAFHPSWAPCRGLSRNLRTLQNPELESSLPGETQVGGKMCKIWFCPIHGLANSSRMLEVDPLPWYWTGGAKLCRGRLICSLGWIGRLGTLTPAEVKSLDEFPWDQKTYLWIYRESPSLWQECLAFLGSGKNLHFSLIMYLMISSCIAPKNWFSLNGRSIKGFLDEQTINLTS